MSPFWGENYPNSGPRSIRLQLPLGPSGELVELQANRDQVRIKRDGRTGVTMMSFDANLIAGTTYTVRPNMTVSADCPDDPLFDGRYPRLFGGWVGQPDSTNIFHEMKVAVQCVDYNLLLRKPPKQFSRPYPGGGGTGTIAGTPVIATTSVTNVSAGSNRTFVVLSANNLYPPDAVSVFDGKRVIAANADGSNEEEIVIKAISSSNGLSLTADFTSSKTGSTTPWKIFGGISDEEALSIGWKQLIQKTEVTAALGSTGSQTITPQSMAAIAVGETLVCFSPTNADFEYVRVTAVTSTTFTATFTSTKAASWRIHVLHRYEGIINYCYNDTGLTTSTASATAGSGVVITPASMENILVGRPIRLENADGTGYERCLITAVTATTFTVQTLALNKTANFKIYNGLPVQTVGINRVNRSLPVLNLIGTPGQAVQTIIEKNFDTTNAPRGYMSVVRDNAAHSIPFYATFLYYDALGSGAPVTDIALSDELDINLATQARYFVGHNRRFDGVQHINKQAVRGSNGAEGEYTDGTQVGIDKRVIEGEVYTDPSLKTNAQCDDLAYTIVQNYKDDKETWRASTLAWLDPDLLIEPFRLSIENRVEPDTPITLDIASVELGSFQGMSQWNFEIGSGIAALGSQLIPYNPARPNLHRTSPPIATGRDFQVTLGGASGSEPTRVADPKFALYDQYNHFLGYAESTPLLTPSANFTAVDTTRTYAVDTSGGSRVVSLPKASEHPYQKFTFKNTGGGANALSFALYSGDTTDAPTLSGQEQVVTVKSDPVNNKWRTTSSHGLVPIGLVQTVNLGDGDGSTVLVAAFGKWIDVGFAGTIVGVRVYTDVSGSPTFHLQKSSYSGWDTFSTLDPSAFGPSSAKKYEVSSFSGWTTAFSAKDVFRPQLVSNSVIKEYLMAVDVVRS